MGKAAWLATTTGIIALIKPFVFTPTWHEVQQLRRMVHDIGTEMYDISEATAACISHMTSRKQCEHGAVRFSHGPQIGSEFRTGPVALSSVRKPFLERDVARFKS